MTPIVVFYACIQNKRNESKHNSSHVGGMIYLVENKINLDLLRIHLFVFFLFFF